jgi:TspO/MBR family
MEPRPRLWCTGDNRCLCRVLRRPACHLSEPRSLVRGARQTIIQSTQLGLCPCLDNPLCADGICHVAYFAAAPSLGRTPISAELVLHSACTQCGIVVDVLRCQQSAARPDQYRSAIPAILATVVAFHRLDRMAAWCLVLLVAWVAFASVLNVAIWRLNG